MRKIAIQKVGADPEVFFRTKAGTPQSVEGLIGGTKAFPMEVKGLPQGFFLQEDNVAAEYNIPPASNANEFSINLQKGLRVLKQIANKNSCDLAFVSALHFPMDQLFSPQARTLGCEPDWNVWLDDFNPRPQPPMTLRTAAGHVHISWPDPDEEQRNLFAKALDVFLGVPSLLITAQNERRSLYGRAGCIRKKDYGIEYRVLGNEWLDKKAYRMHVFNNVMHTANVINRNTNMIAETFEELGEEIQDTINNHDVDQALRLIDHFDVPPFPAVAQHA